jgi:hypothetical protein
MTEAEWLAATDPVPMLRFFEGKGSERQLRLFAVACCQHVWPLLDHPPCLPAVDVAARYADGEAARDELAAARRTVDEAFSIKDSYLQSKIALAVCGEPLWVIPAISGIEQLLTRQYAAHRKSQRAKMGPVPTPRYTALFRDIFGNLFRPVTFSNEWRTDTAILLARQMYESRDFGAMPILADALQDAGCEEAGILDHCRGPGPHVRGCWVIDLVLGKE